MKNSETKMRIVEAADTLFYQQGFEHTSFAQIAKNVGISRGNFYYHFKTKDQILDEVIHQRLNRTNDMIEVWTIQGDTPVKRIMSFVNILLNNQSKIKQFGCPVGTLTMELGKLNHPAKQNATQLFTLFRVWLKQQFEQIGLTRQSDTFAMHILALSQGAATLANAFPNENIIQKEINQINDWLSHKISAQQI